MNREAFMAKKASEGKLAGGFQNVFNKIEGRTLRKFKYGTLLTGFRKNRVVTSKGQAQAIAAAKINKYIRVTKQRVISGNKRRVKHKRQRKKANSRPIGPKRERSLSPQRLPKRHAPRKKDPNFSFWRN